MIAAEINELKTLVKPPMEVIRVLTCVCIVMKPDFDEASEYEKKWQNSMAFKMINAMNFVKKCEELMNNDHGHLYELDAITYRK